MHPRSVHIAYADEETLLRKTVVTHVLGIAEGFHVIFDTADCAEMLVRIVNWELRPDICIMGAGYTDYQVFGEASKKNPSIKFLVFTKAFHISILVTMI